MTRESTTSTTLTQITGAIIALALAAVVIVTLTQIDITAIDITDPVAGSVAGVTAMIVAPIAMMLVIGSKGDRTPFTTGSSTGSKTVYPSGRSIAGLIIAAAAMTGSTAAVMADRPALDTVALDTVAIAGSTGSTRRRSRSARTRAWETLFTAGGIDARSHASMKAQPIRDAGIPVRITEAWSKDTVAVEVPADRIDEARFIWRSR